jgi:prevent-host-death family protein
MVKPGRSLGISAAKSGLSEVIRSVRRTGEAVVITVDGEPAAQIAPVAGESRRLTSSEVAAIRVLWEALDRIPRREGSFDANRLIGEGRR